MASRRSANYWKKRFELLEQSQNQQGVQCYAELERKYRQAQRQIETQIQAWYGRFASNNGISIQDARKMLTNKELAELKWDINEYIRYGEQNALSGTWVKELENASARYHISRLEALKLQTQQQIEVLFGNQLDSIDSAMKSIYTSGYYHTAYEIQKGFGVGWDFATLDDKTISKIINKPWAVDGQNFSSRIWTNKQKLVNELNTTLTQNIILGQDPQKAIDEIARKLNVSKTSAGRLVMTEEAFFSSAAQKDCFNELDVEQFEIVATLDSHTSEICQEMDGKVFPMSQWEVGITAPPFHVWCRTTTVPAFGDEFDHIGERAARGEDGKTYHVPGDMTYKDWQKAFVEGDKSGLKEVNPDGTMEKKPEVKELNKLKQSGMTEAEYQEYLNIINSHSNQDVIKLYSEYADEIKKVSLTAKGGAYQPASVTLNFTYPKYADMNKYGTLAHEYGHFFDDKAGFDGLHFKEMEAVRKATGLDTTFKNAASSSDEFLAAMRSDKVHIKSIMTADAKADLIAHNASSGVQDAIDGLFTKSRLCWGHGEKYYNRKYATVEQMDRILNSSLKKKLQQAYKDLGLDASNQSKVKSLCRQYEAASEAWANILSAEVCGGESLEYVKKYLPNSYQAMLNILKGVKVNE